MQQDRRLLLVRNKEQLEKEQSLQTRTSEYQIIADSHIVGRLSYGPYFFTPWEFTNKAPGKERLLCLRVREMASTEGPQDWKTATRGGFYHGGGIASELVALSSFFLRRRLKLGPMVRMDDLPIMLEHSIEGAPPYLSSGNSNLADLEEWLQLVEKLKPELHEPFVLAAKLYSEAIELSYSKADLAYLNLISAVEVVAGSCPFQRPSLAEFDPPIASLVSQIEEQQLRSELEKAILAREHFIGRKFVSFIALHTDDTFWTSTERPERGRIQPAELADLLKRLYDQRSRTLHNGEPFPPGVPWTEEELPTGLAMSFGQRKWDRKDFIPTLPFFERLVNHVLKNFLRRNLQACELEL